MSRRRGPSGFSLCLPAWSCGAPGSVLFPCNGHGCFSSTGRGRSVLDGPFFEKKRINMFLSWTMGQLLMVTNRKTVSGHTRHGTRRISHSLSCLRHLRDDNRHHDVLRPFFQCKWSRILASSRRERLALMVLTNMCLSSCLLSHRRAGNFRSCKICLFSHQQFPICLWFLVFSLEFEEERSWICPGRPIFSCTLQMAPWPPSSDEKTGMSSALKAKKDLSHRAEWPNSLCAQYTSRESRSLRKVWGKPDIAGSTGGRGTLRSHVSTGCFST